jgi:putative two-component system response regulator
LIKNTNLDKSVPLIAKQHHERLDGTGYPYGLLIDKIHIYSQIVMAADVFDALTTSRPYRGPFSIIDSLEIIQKGRGNKFNNEVIDALCDLFSYTYKVDHKNGH